MNRINLCVSLSSIGLAVATLAACGGGGSSSSADAVTPVATAAGVTVATYITDNLATDYAQVWVGVLKLAVVKTATGVETVLFESATPAVYKPFVARFGRAIDVHRRAVGGRLRPCWA